MEQPTRTPTMRVSRRIYLSMLALAAITVTTGCGGGGEGEPNVLVEQLANALADETGAPIGTWVPESRTQNIDGQSIEIYLFPFALHQRAILSSYVSKVGTTSTRNYSITGRMTTPTVTAGNYLANSSVTITYAGSTLFEGVSVIPAGSETRRTNISLNGVSQSDESATSTSYYDTRYGLRIGSKGATYYKVIDPDNSGQFPDLVAAGDEGDLFAYKVFSDSSKKTQLGRDVLSFKTISVAAATATEYSARVEFTVRSYSTAGQLLGQQTITDDLAYNVKTGARSTNVSIIVEDIVGTTTSRLSFKRLN